MEKLFKQILSDQENTFSFRFEPFKNDSDLIKSNQYFWN